MVLMLFNCIGCDGNLYGWSHLIVIPFLLLEIHLRLGNCYWTCWILIRNNKFNIFERINSKSFWFVPLSMGGHEKRGIKRGRCCLVLVDGHCLLKEKTREGRIVKDVKYYQINWGIGNRTDFFFYLRRLYLYRSWFFDIECS